MLRPYVARIGKTADGRQATMTYCGLTNLGMAFELDNRPDGKEVELVPLTQLENNLILMDKSTGHVGQQINGIDETALLKKIGGQSYHETNRRPPEEVVKGAKLHGSKVGKEIPTWRMKLGDFVQTFPDGEVFINDYRMYPDIKKPIKTICKYLVGTFHVLHLTLSIP